MRARILEKKLNTYDMYRRTVNESLDGRVYD